MKEEYKKYGVVDLFCGVGGLTQGFINQSFNVLSGIDSDKTCKYAYEKNNEVPFIPADLTVMHSDDIKAIYPDNKRKILIGCAPCQAFSTYSKNKATNDKWRLLYTFSRIIRHVQPEIVSMENVPNLLSYKGGKVFNDFIQNLKEQGYYYSYSVVKAHEYGVPQQRKRLILFASKYGEIDIIPPLPREEFVSVREAIGHLPPLEDGEHDANDQLHQARSLSPINKRRIQATSEGGGWHEWDEELLLECHKKSTGKTYRSVYGRMNWDEVSPTLTTQCTGLGNGRFGHPDQDRAISLREAAIIQTFPESYSFFDPELEFSHSRIETHIGNAVPVRLGQVIAETIKSHLQVHGR